MSRSVSIVSPIYNDMSSMPLILARLEKEISAHFRNWEILLIDDKSTDGSRAWITSFVHGKKHIRLVLHKKNEGIARTYRELYTKAAHDIVVLFSLDGQWNPIDAVRLVQTLTETNLDIVVGVRTKKSYTPWRAFVSFVYNTLTRIFFGCATRDAGSIKAIKRSVVNNIPIISHGVFDEAERLIRANRMGFRIGFIDVAHIPTKKIKSGIGLSHVLEAIVDSVRVRIQL